MAACMLLWLHGIVTRFAQFVLDGEIKSSQEADIWRYVYPRNTFPQDWMSFHVSFVVKPKWIHHLALTRLLSIRAWTNIYQATSLPTRGIFSEKKKNGFFNRHAKHKDVRVIMHLVIIFHHDYTDQNWSKKEIKKSGSNFQSCWGNETREYKWQWSLKLNFSLITGSFFGSNTTYQYYSLFCKL